MDNNKQKGFTLLEVMIVLAVTAVLSVGSLSSYRSFDQTKKLEADTEEFIESIELAKKLVSSGERPCINYTGQYALTWGAERFAVQPQGCAVIQEHELRGNIFETATSSALFNPFGRGTSLTSDVCILIRNVYHDKCNQITIETSGTAMSEPNPTCSCN